jgi:RimJ/RimL family protein N-acetyltransferase
MHLVSGTHDTAEGRALAAWFGAHVGRPQSGPYAVLGWLDQGGAIRAVALFQHFNGCNIDIHVFGAVTRQTLREALRYPFRQLGCLRVTAKPYRGNKVLRDFLTRVGFVQEGVMLRYYGARKSSDAVVYRLDRKTAEKWMD